MPELLQPDVKDAATRAFSAPPISFYVPRQGRSVVAYIEFILVENASLLPGPSAAAPVAIEYEEPLLRPSAAALFSDVAEGLFPETVI
jgi:hypothetical protein